MTTCARPVSDCAACGSTVYLVESVRTKRPGLVSWFSSALIASRISGACWNSSISTGSGPEMRKPGSATAAARTSSRSRSNTVRSNSAPSSESIVLFPTVRGPVRITTGSSSMLCRTTSRSRLGRSPLIAFTHYRRPHQLDQGGSAGKIYMLSVGRLTGISWEDLHGVSGKFAARLRLA